jgi:hypothetical protein
MLNVSESSHRSFLTDYILWHVEPLLGNDRHISNYTTAVANNASPNKHVSTATIALQWKNSVLYAGRAEML